MIRLDPFCGCRSSGPGWPRYHGRTAARRLAARRLDQPQIGGHAMPEAYARDLIGYGANPPHPKWPGDARIAINFVMNYEEGSEPSIPDGDGISEGGLTEVAAADPGRQGRDLAAESMFEYGSRVGFWRVMRIFQERGLPLTAFGCALALERHPPAAP